MRIFHANTGVHGLCDELPATFTVDDSLDVLILIGIALTLVSGVSLAVFFVISSAMPGSSQPVPAASAQMVPRATTQTAQYHVHAHTQLRAAQPAQYQESYGRPVEQPCQRPYAPPIFDQLYEQKRITHYVHQ